MGASIVGLFISVLMLPILILVLVASYYFFKSFKRSKYTFFFTICTAFCVSLYLFVWPWIIHFNTVLQKGEELAQAEECLRDKLGFDGNYVPWMFVKFQDSLNSVGVLTPITDIEKVTLLEKNEVLFEQKLSRSPVSENNVKFSVLSSNYQSGDNHTENNDVTPTLNLKLQEQQNKRSLKQLVFTERSVFNFQFSQILEICKKSFREGWANMMFHQNLDY